MTTSKFVIMKHEAKKAGLHYDLRFRIPKSKDWDSYAIRKGVPTEAGKKVLAIKTTIHSEKEALLTGNITDGYGAGKLTKWDNGTCIIHKYNDKHITIEFKGSKVKGIYHMISTGFIDKDFKKPTYLLFKGKAIKEGTGMISRVPAISNGDEVEEGPTEDEGKSLDGSLTESVDNTKDYAMIMNLTTMKGFFKKRVGDEYLLILFKVQAGFVILQIVKHLGQNLYIGIVIGGGRAEDYTNIEGTLNMIRRESPLLEVLEDRIPLKVFMNSTTITYTFLKTSKYLGKTLKLYYKPSELPKDYYKMECLIKKGFGPEIQYKIDKNADEFNLAKKIRAFTTSRLKKIIGSQGFKSSLIKKIFIGRR